MKKTIQINIAGVVFNIEEDAYDKLNNYLNAIQQYFSSYEGSQEIVSDIEARIAEKFWIKNKADNGTAQVITLEGVNDLVKSMGSVADFEAIQEEEDLKGVSNPMQESSFTQPTAATTESSSTADSKQAASAGPKRLYRDVKRKALGGVLAGLAHYFNMDVVWMRIIFLFLFLGIPPIIEDFAPVSGFVFLGYFVCWIVFPPNASLVEDEKIKKYYRDKDNKVLGGVASGLSAYFGVDVTVIRLLFVLGVLLFGTGFLAYIILWIVAPKAQTLTQKMEMKGEPVTLSNIETNIKEGLKVEKNAPENALTKILLFPFRLIAVVIKGIGDILKNLGPVARVLAGIVLMVFALSVIVGVIAAVAAFFGVMTGIEGTEFFDNSPFRVFSSDIHPGAGLFAFLAMFTPFLALLLVGMILLTNRRIGTRNFWVSLLALWLVGLMGSGIMATKYALNFKKKSRVEVVKNFSLPTQMLVLDSYNNHDDDFDGLEVKEHVSVELKGYEGTDLKLEQRFEAKGRTKAEAEESAKNVVYDVKQKDSVLVFDEDMLLGENARFRAQGLRMTLYIPYDKPFKLTRRFYNQVFSRWNTDFDLSDGDIDRYTFIMERGTGMICRDCPKLSDEEREALRDRNNYNDDDVSFDTGVFDGKGHYEKKFDINDFRKIGVGGAFIVTVRQGDTYSVVADSDNQENVDDLYVNERGGKLEIEFRDKFSFSRRREKTRINITMPKLEGLDLSGASTLKVIGFKDKSQDIDIKMSGAVKAAIDVDAREIEIDASGAVNADLRGSAEKMIVDVSGACQINTQKMNIDQMSASASGASRIRLGNVKNLNSSNTSGASRITRD